MNTVYRWTLALSFGWYAAQGVCAERLGGISDETAPPAAQPQPEAEGGITYRVICSPEGEMLPECGQPPISDSLAAEPSKAVGPETPVAAEVQEQTLHDDQANEVAEPAPPKKASSHKKRSKKTVKKDGKKTAKPEKKRKRH